MENIFSIVHGSENKKRERYKNEEEESKKFSFLPFDMQERAESLREWRRELASTRGIAPYRIFNNRTLLHLAVQNPRTLEELIKIKGIKTKRVEDYGQSLLDFLKMQEPL